MRPVEGLKVNFVVINQVMIDVNSARKRNLYPA
jgi:hypothetical protein